MPNSIRRKNALDFPREADGIIEIIKHRDRRHDLGRRRRGRSECLRGEEVGYQLDVVGIVALEFLAGRINSDPCQAR